MITWKHFYLRSLIASVFGLRGGGGYSQLLFLLLSDVRITILSLFGAKYYRHSVAHQHNNNSTALQTLLSALDCIFKDLDDLDDLYMIF